MANRDINGPFQSFADFCERIQNDSVNKKCIESLIKAGAFDEFEQTRSTLIASFENIIDSISDSSRKSIKGQVSMFDLGGEEQAEDLEKIKYAYTTLKEYSERELLSMEKEMLGLYISGHPLEGIRQEIANQTTINTFKMRQIDNESEELSTTSYRDGQTVRYAGIISSVKKKFTKTNKIMAFITIEDLYGQCEIIVFENCYQNCSNILIEDNVVLVEGRLSIRENEETKIVASKIIEFNAKKQENDIKANMSSNQTSNIYVGKVLEINVTNLDETQKSKLRGAIQFFSGDKNNIAIRIVNGNKVDMAGGIKLCKQALNQIQEITGIENACIIEK